MQIEPSDINCSTASSFQGSPCIIPVSDTKSSNCQIFKAHRLSGFDLTSKLTITDKLGSHSPSTFLRRLYCTGSETGLMCTHAQDTDMSNNGSDRAIERKAGCCSNDKWMMAENG